MKEGPPQFGEPIKRKRLTQAQIFPDGDDLPLMSGTPPVVKDSPFTPQPMPLKQQELPGLPGIDYDHIRELDRERRARRRR